MWSGTAPNTEPMAESDSAKIDKLAEGAIKQSDGDMPGMWLAVWDPEKGMYVGAYGEAELPDVAATPDDHNRIGSLTKTFTATATLKLVDSGEISLDDTIADLLPDLADSHPEIGEITVEQLIGMRSGIPDYANTGLVIGQIAKTPDKVWTPEEIIDDVLSQEKLEKPGTPGYSTTNYLILGQILEAVTGDSVEDVLNQTAADAGLEQTKLQPPDETAMPDPASHGYINAPGVKSLKEAGVAFEPGTDVTEWSPSWGGAGGGMYSTADELGQWAASGFGNSQLSNSLGDKRISDTSENPDAGTYGLGIQRFGTDWIGHTGQIIGWEAIAIYNPKTGATAVAMVNETGSLDAAVLILAKLYPDFASSLL